jgi:LysM repeat protein
MADDPRFAQLKQKYGSVLNLIQQKGVQLSHLHVQDNKLFIQGSAPSEAVKNDIWNQIKLVDPGFSDLVCDLSAPAGTAAPAAAADTAKTYTVQPGDTLSKIAKQFYGNANEYMKIFKANTDQLDDPDKIKVGQVLMIP